MSRDSDNGGWVHSSVLAKVYFHFHIGQTGSSFASIALAVLIGFLPDLSMMILPAVMFLLWSQVRRKLFIYLNNIPSKNLDSPVSRKLEMSTSWTWRRHAAGKKSHSKYLVTVQTIFNFILKSLFQLLKTPTTYNPTPPDSQVRYEIGTGCWKCFLSNSDYS